MGRDKERQHSCALPIQPPCTASFCIVNEQKLPINSPTIDDHIQRQSISVTAPQHDECSGSRSPFTSLSCLITKKVLRVEGKLLFLEVPQVPVPGMPLIKIWIVPSRWRNLGTAPGHLPVQGEGYFSKLYKNAKAIQSMSRWNQSAELAKQTNAKEQFCCHLQQQEPGIIRYRSGELLGISGSGNRNWPRVNLTNKNK